MKLLEVITSVLWRRICLNCKWIKEQDEERDTPDTATPAAEPRESLVIAARMFLLLPSISDEFCHPQPEDS